MEKIQGLENIDKVDEFIKLTEQVLKNEEKYKIWNAGKSMYGIYSERDKGTYMVRPRFIESKITLDNLIFFLDLAEKYGDKRLHLTTRQDIQLHGNKKENLAKILKELKAIKEKRVFAMPWSPMNCARRVEYPIDMLIIAKAAYPEIFADIKVHKFAIKFYRDVYNVDEKTARNLLSEQILDWTIESDF